MVAGLLIATIGAPLTLLVDVVTYLVAALLVARVGSPFRADDDPGPARPGPRGRPGAVTWPMTSGSPRGGYAGTARCAS